MDGLTRIQALNLELAQAAVDDDWPRVAELDEERARLLAALPLSGDPALHAVVSAAFDVTRAVLEKALGARQSVMDELRGVQRGQRGANAYQQQP